jgi:hypothetical protein
MCLFYLFFYQKNNFYDKLKFYFTISTMAPSFWSFRALAHRILFWFLSSNSVLYIFQNFTSFINVKKYGLQATWNQYIVNFNIKILIKTKEKLKLHQKGQDRKDHILAFRKLIITYLFNI